jgi:hypothetical protein
MSRNDYIVARFALSAVVLPSVTEALTVVEMARFAVSSQRADESYSLALAGKTEGEGVPLSEDHAHAHFWATDEDADVRLDQRIARTRFGDAAQRLSSWWEKGSALA